MEIDQELIYHASDGDETSFCKLVTAYQEEVFSICYFYAETEEGAYNLSYDSFRKIRNAIPLYTNTDDFHLWLVRIVCNTCRESNVRKADAVSRLAAILKNILAFSTADAASVLDLSIEQLELCLNKSYNLSDLSVPTGTHDLASGIRKSIKAEQQGSSPLKMLSHFRFTILAIVIVLIMLLAAKMQNSTVQNNHTVADSSVTSSETTAGNHSAEAFLPVEPESVKD